MFWWGSVPRSTVVLGITAPQDRQIPNDVAIGTADNEYQVLSKHYRRIEMRHVPSTRCGETDAVVHDCQERRSSDEVGRSIGTRWLRICGVG